MARETKRRVRHNIETLIPRLEALGYEFGYRLLAEESSDFTFEEVAEIEGQCPRFRPPLPDARERLAKLEAQVGALPLSLRAWGADVGTFDFVGQTPQRWDDLGYQCLQGAAYKMFEREHPNYTAKEYRQFKQAHPEFQQGIAAENIYLDPLVIQPIKHTLQHARPNESMPGKISVPLAPDHDHKYFVSGSGPYEIFAPCLAADALLEGEWHNTTFVDYLCICFRWGGFRGMQSAPRLAATDLAVLTRGLLPL